MAEFSQPTEKLIQKYQAWQTAQQKKEGVATIHVDEVASSVASFYEKIRGIVDWKEEHLMRRAAISRSLKRRLFLLKNGESMAEPLILELVRGGHFPNDKIPASKIADVQKALDKYIFILRGNSLISQPILTKRKKSAPTGVHLYDWIMDIASCEMEEILSAPQKEQSLIEYMVDSIRSRVKVREGIISIGGLSEEEKDAQVFIAVHRALLKLDAPIISYNLLKKRYPGWMDLTKENNLLQEISQNIQTLAENISKELNHPLAEKFYRLCEKYDTPYLIVSDIVSQDPLSVKEKMQNPEELEKMITGAYDKRLKDSKAKFRRAAIYATLSIFATKILLALALEVPVDKALTGQFSLTALIISIAFPPLLMFFLILTIRPPSKENRQLAVMETIKIIHAGEKNDVYTIEAKRKRGLLMNAIVNLFYFLAAVLSFGTIILGLHYFEFPPLSYVIFIIFISLISFAGMKIRERSKELQIAESKGNFITFFIDLFSLPIVSLGRWLSSRFVKYNIIVVFFNSLIDMPFQVFVEFLEQWRFFLKEKKEEIH